MRLSKLGWLVVVVVIAAGLVVFAALRWGGSGRTFDGGAGLRVAKVTYGKWESLNLDSLWEQVKAKIPPQWLARFGTPPAFRGSSSWYQNTTIHSNENALYIYLTRVEPITGGYASVDAQQAELLDEHDCVYMPTQAGGNDDGRLSLPGAPVRSGGMGYSVGWFRFEAFPRHEKEFRLRVFDGKGATLAEFPVRNPAPPPNIANWVPQPLPITNTQGNLSFILTQLKVETNFTGPRMWIRNQFDMKPKYKILEGGQSSTNWQALDTELYDTSGNFASKIYSGGIGWLSTREAAWKLRVRFFGSEASPAASNTIWTLRGLEVPGQGKFTMLNRSQEMQGIVLRAIAFAGVGNFTYSNDIPTAIPASDVPPGDSSWNTKWVNNRRGGASIPIETVHGLTPHLLIEIGELSEDQRLTVRATDDQGREFYAYDWRNYGGNKPEKDKPGEVRYLERGYHPQDKEFLTFNLPADAKTVDLTFCLHACLTPEFIFKPPGAANLPQSIAAK